MQDFAKVNLLSFSPIEYYVRLLPEGAETLNY